MAAVLLSPPYIQFFNTDGVTPLAGGLIYTYAAGTTSPKATYTDASATIAASNPVVLDSLGRGVIWGIGSYKIDVRTSANVSVKVTDNISTFITATTQPPSYFQSFSGDGTTTVFTLSQNVGTDSKALLVFIGNIIQNPSSFTVSGTTLTFNTAPASGTNNIYVFAPLTLLGTASAYSDAAQSFANAANVSATAASNSATASANSATASANSATAAASSSSAASTSATTATTQAGIATTQATNAGNSATAAGNSATAAATSATNAASSAALAGSTLTATSTSSVTIGTGNLTFTTQANKNFINGQYITAAASGGTVYGMVQSYSGTTLVINSTNTTGSGTYTSWNIGVGGAPGASGTGSGTVTSVSVTSANGVSGSVANATSTPAITVSLGAITPTTVNNLTLTALTNGFTIAGGTSFSRLLTVSNNAQVIGSNTGDQTITLTGDVTGSGTGSFAATLANSGVTAGTYNSVTVDAKGRVTAGSTNTPTIPSYTSSPQPITPGGGLTLSHGLGATPTLVQSYLVCVTAQGGYSVGDTVPINGWWYLSNAGASEGAAITIDSTNLTIRYTNATAVYTLQNKNTGVGFNVTNSGWNVIFKAWVL